MNFAFIVKILLPLSKLTSMTLNLKNGGRGKQKRKVGEKKMRAHVVTPDCTSPPELSTQDATSHGSSSNAAYEQAPPYQHPHSSAPAGMTGGTTT